MNILKFMGNTYSEVNFMENKSNEKTKGTKTFFLAVGISLAMILIACIVSYPQVITPDIENQLAEVSDTSNVEESVTTEPLGEVNNIATNVPKDTESTNLPLDTTTVTQDIISQTDTTQVVTSSKSVTSNNYMDTTPIMPIANGEILSEFSNGELVKSSTSGIWQTHNGMDILAEITTPVLAMTDGTITKVYEDALLGICVTIDHTDFTANYCNLDSGVLVTEGATIEKGGIIGTVGDTAISESALESHLHLETLQGGKYVNPMDIIGK